MTKEIPISQKSRSQRNMKETLFSLLLKQTADTTPGTMLFDTEHLAPNPTHHLFPFVEPLLLPCKVLTLQSQPWLMTTLEIDFFFVKRLPKIPSCLRFIHLHHQQKTRPAAPLVPVIPVINEISRVNPLITGAITHLLSGMSHQVRPHLTSTWHFRPPPATGRSHPAPCAP